MPAMSVAPGGDVVGSPITYGGAGYALILPNKGSPTILALYTTRRLRHNSVMSFARSFGSTSRWRHGRAFTIEIEPGL
jgi:hypothetical protein